MPSSSGDESRSLGVAIDTSILYMSLYVHEFYIICTYIRTYVYIDILTYVSTLYYQIVK